MITVPTCLSESIVPYHQLLTASPIMSSCSCRYVVVVIGVAGGVIAGAVRCFHWIPDTMGITHEDHVMASRDWS